MFNEAIHPITRTKYKLPTKNYHPSDFFQFFEEIQEQEEQRANIGLPSKEYGLKEVEHARDDPITEIFSELKRKI